MPTRRADPVGGLLQVFDRRARQAALPMPTLGTVVEAAPDLVVELDTGPRIRSPYVVNQGNIDVGNRCLMVPIQEGHDYAMIALASPFVGSE